MSGASSPHDVARVEDATSLAELVGEYTSLRQIGRYYVGRCPIEAEDTLSLTVNPETERFICWHCWARGGPVAFLCNVERTDFDDGVRRLSARAGITLTQAD